MNKDDLAVRSDIEHSGVKRRSGAHKWGTGEVPYQHEPWFTWQTQVDKLREEGLTETEIARALNMSSGDYRAKTALRKAEKDAQLSSIAWTWREKGMSKTAIAKRLGVSEGTVRNYLKSHLEVKENKINNIQNTLKEAVEKNEFIDVGAGTEVYMNIKDTKLRAAVKGLEEQGYKLHTIQVPQATNPDKATKMTILTKAGVTASDVHNNLDKISFVGMRMADDGLSTTSLGLLKPKSLDSKRLMVRYAEEGGLDKDGVIELRRGVDDISLGESRYAQVRIAVDGTHYLKGMAIYSDKMPPGVDVVFNTNKHKGTPVMGPKDNSVLKPMKTKTNTETGETEIDWDNPFGATIKETMKNTNGMLIGGQREYTDKNGKKQLSVINKVNEEGDWDEWKRTLASQMLSKQETSVAKRQLDIASLEKRAMLDDIKALTNPIVKKKMLADFAEQCDTAASELRAAAFPRQASKVIIPLTTIKDNEIYAPFLNNGEHVALIRFPHGGRFEIPELTVNNKNKEGSSVLTKEARDAVGISSKVAAKLSGADFDGDTVLVIPNNNGQIKSMPSLEALKDFDPKEAFPGYPGMRKMTSSETQREMGIISNLITDMTIQGAKTPELARAVKHSMVVIDAEKHGLDWKTSEKQNMIQELKDKYQTNINPLTGRAGGASTLLSRANKEYLIDQVYDRYDIDPNTGKKIYKETGKTYKKFKWIEENQDIERDEEGHAVYKELNKKTSKTMMDMVDDANELSTGTRMEKVYANFANQMKAMANEARKELMATQSYKKSPTAAKAYADEVSKLYADLNIMLRNSPLERKAQAVANLVIKQKLAEDPTLKGRDRKKERKRMQEQAIREARRRMGTVKRADREIKITPRQWEAIQAHAVAPTVLEKILTYADADLVKQYATPKDRPVISKNKLLLARQLLAQDGNTIGEVADRIGVSPSTLSKYLSEK